MQVCIMTAVSRGGNTFIHTYNTGRPTDVDGYDLCQHIDQKNTASLITSISMTGVFKSEIAV